MNETMSLAQLAAYLCRDARELGQLAFRKEIPGSIVNEKWCFKRREINQWLEQSLSKLSAQELAGIEAGVGNGSADERTEPFVAALLSEDIITVPLMAATRASIPRAMVELASRTGHLHLPQTLLNALLDREKISSTALMNGVAVLHPSHPLLDAVNVPLLVYPMRRNNWPLTEQSLKRRQAERLPSALWTWEVTNASASFEPFSVRDSTAM